MKCDAVILDIDGTIWNTTEIAAGAWNTAFIESGYTSFSVTAAVLQKEFGRTMDRIARDLWPALDAEKRSELLALCCKKEHEAIAENTSDISYEGVIPTVTELSSAIDFYIVSNCQCGYIPLMLQKTGLTGFIKDSVCFGENGNTKGQNISLIVQRNKLERPVYIGDTQGDCDSCKEAAVPFIWASYGFGTADSFSGRLSCFADLKNILFELL